MWIPFRDLGVSWKMIMDLPVYIIKNNLRELDVSHNEYLDIINSL